jgi:hypothetical protein
LGALKNPPVSIVGGGFKMTCKARPLFEYETFAPHKKKYMIVDDLPRKRQR